MSGTSRTKPSGNAGASLGFEAQLWAAADKMRGHMDASEYKHVCLGHVLRKDLHPGLKADFILANPPFNMSDWGGENLRQDVRWKFGMPPVNNANYAWIQHFIHHLSPVGVAGFVLANGARNTHYSSMSTTDNNRAASLSTISRTE